MIKSLKRNLFRAGSAFFSLLTGLFTSNCVSNYEAENVVMYGVPICTAHGKVTYMANSVPGIEIKSLYEQTATNQDGEYYVQIPCDFSNVENNQLTISDIDGADNLGKFITQTKQIPSTSNSDIEINIELEKE